VVFRLGGDEFAILMPSVPLHEAERRCKQISALLSQPYLLDGVKAVVGASFGVAEVLAGAGETCDEALRRSDEALYEAKAKAPGAVVVAHRVCEPIRAFG